MTVDLEGIRLKIERAEGHIADLRSLIKETLESTQPDFRSTWDPAERDLVVTVHNAPQVPAQLSAILGDAIFNLRAALDHLAWQLVIFDGKTPNRTTCFPLLKRVAFQGGHPVAPQLIPAIDNELVRATLERCQPYWSETELGCAQDYRKHRLWQLTELNNIDKHRKLLVAVCGLDVNSMWWGMPLGQESPKLRWAQAAQEGQAIAWFHFPTGAPPDGFDPHPSLQIALREPVMPEAWYSDLGHVVENLKFWVKEWVFEWRFERIFNGEAPLDI